LAPMLAAAAITVCTDSISKAPINNNRPKSCWSFGNTCIFHSRYIYFVLLCIVALVRVLCQAFFVFLRSTSKSNFGVTWPPCPSYAPEFFRSSVLWYGLGLLKLSRYCSGIGTLEVEGRLRSVLRSDFDLYNILLNRVSCSGDRCRV
jgi:hypothetical protein